MTDAPSAGSPTAGRTMGEVARKSLGWTFANNVAGRSLTVVSSLVLARLLVPREFGVFAIALVVYSLLFTLNDIGISSTIVRWPGSLDDVAPTAMTLIVVMSLIVYGVFFIAAPFCCRLVGAPGATGVSRLLALAIVIDGVFAVPTGMLTRYFRQDLLTIAELVNSAVATLISIVLALHGFGVWSLGWGRLIGNLVGAILCAVFAKQRYRPGFNLEAAKKLLRSGTPLLGTTLVTIGVFNVDYLTIGRILGPTPLGYYVLAFNISGWAISIITVGITRVSVPIFARLRSNPEALRITFIRGMTFLALATIPVCVSIGALSHPLIQFMYGSRWLPGAAALAFLALFAVVRILQDLAMDTLIAVGKSSSTLVLQTCWLVVLIPALIVGAHIDGITGVAAGHVLVGFAVVLPMYTFVISRLGVSVRALLKHLAWPIFGAALSAVVARVASERFETPIFGLLVGGICGLLVYIVAVLPTRRILASSSGTLDMSHEFPGEATSGTPEVTGTGRQGDADHGLASSVIAETVPDAGDLLSKVDGVPVWFGPPDRRLFGWLHVPETKMARAGVVLCASLGIEGRRAHVAYRVLAAHLARMGFLVLRFDYDGMGDSAGSDRDPDRVSAWTASVRHAVSFIDQTGVVRRVVVGMRVGATIAVNAELEGLLDALVLWDPCATGRGYVREQQMIFKVIDPAGGVSRNDVELPGQVMTNTTAEALGALRLDALQNGRARRLLVLERPERPLAPDLRQQLSENGAEWAEATGQSELLDAISPNDKPPLVAIGAIAAWLDRAVDESVAPVAYDTPASAVVGRKADGTTITERVVFLGPLGLVGVLAESDHAAFGPIAIMLNDGHEHHVGPARFWVELSRLWASFGIKSVRVDLSGIGDSPLRPGQTERVVYPPEAIADIEEIAKSVRPGDPRDVVLLGICSGAHHAIESGIALGVRATCAINPAMSTSRWRDPGSSHGALAWIHSLLSHVHPRVASAAMLAISQVRPKLSSAGSLILLESGGTNALVICGDGEAHQVERLVHWKRTHRRLSSHDRFVFEHLSGLEHSLLTDEPRNTAASLLTNFMASMVRIDRPIGTAPPLGNETDP